MTAKEFLKQYEYAEMEVSKQKERYEAEQERIGSVGSTLGDGAGMPHGSGVSRQAEDVAIGLADAAKRWLAAMERAKDVRLEVMTVIDQVRGYEGQVLYERYVNLLTWEDVAEKLKYSQSNVFKLHRQALVEVELILMREGYDGDK